MADDKKVDTITYIYVGDILDGKSPIGDFVFERPHMLRLKCRDLITTFTEKRIPYLPALSLLALLCGAREVGFAPCIN
jgi:hypothetical protein